MRPCKKVSSLRLVLVVAMLGTGLSGLAHASDWMDASLGLAPLKFDPSGQIRNRYLHSFSNAPDMQTYAGAAGGSDEPVDLEAISKEMDNPLGSLWLLFLQNDTIQLSDDFPLKDKQWINVTIFQPILPIPLGKDWLLANRPTFSFISAPIPKLNKSGEGRFPDLFPGGGPSFNDIQDRVSTNRKYEFGDIIYPMWLAPRELPKLGGGNLVWGVGPTWIFPTATHDFLGTEKWSVGPTGLVVWNSDKWKLGVLAQQWWSFAGKDDRPNVSKANIQYLYYYNLPHLWQIGAGPNILINWEAGSGNKYTVPVGLGVSKTTIAFGKVPIRLGAEIHYSAIQPDDVSQTWLFRFYMVPLIPSPFAG
jgi:hypothetical protein